MEYLPLVLAFIGGGGLVTALNIWANRRKAKLESDGLADQITKNWRDDALALSAVVLEKDRELGASQRALTKCEGRLEECDC